MSDEILKELKGTYGFEIVKFTHDFAPGVSTYVVQLPHQCGPWIVTDCESIDRAISQLSQFVVEGQLALVALRQIKAKEKAGVSSDTP